MKRTSRLSVILAGLLLLVLIPSFVGLYLFVDRVVAARTIESQSDFMLQQTHSMRLQLTSLLTGMRQLAQSLAINPVVATALAEGDSFAASQVAQQVVAQNILVENVLLVDETGMSVAAAVAASANRDFSSEPFASAILDRGMRFFIDSYAARSGVSDSAVAMISVPVSAGGITAGAVGIAFDMSRFSSEFLRSATVGDTGYFYIIDDRGVMLAHPDEELILADSSSESFARLMLARRGEGAEMGMIEYRFRGTDKNAAFTWLDTLPWAVALTMDTRQFFDLRDEIRIVTAVGYAIVAGAAAVLLIWILRRKMRTVTIRMASLVDAIGNGDLTGASRMKGNDELVSIYHRLLDVTNRLRIMVAGTRDRTNTARERGDTLMAVTEANMTALDAINDDVEAVVKRVG
ncbi:MAG: Cache 3/Cache 2 fusion domain-containing protein, partial [Spirochaetales bacterium]|nr:Cache 3/Cache 2 fusion domain-containing protein [Spirochaetales bacterium]